MRHVQFHPTRRRRASRAGPQRPRRAEARPVDPWYWLSHSEGFRVDSLGGRVGFVEEVRHEEAGATVLAVRAGLLGRRLLLFDARDVAAVVPRCNRLRLRHSAAPLASERAEPHPPLELPRT